MGWMGNNCDAMRNAPSQLMPGSDPSQDPGSTEGSEGTEGASPVEPASVPMFEVVP